MVAFRTDFSQYEPSMGGASVQPEGWYNAIINKTEMAKTRDETKNNHMLVVSFQLSNGQTYIERYNVMNDNPDAVRIAMQSLAFLRGVLRLGQQMNDTAELHNIPLQIFLSVEDAEINGRKVSQNRMRNARFADGTDYKPGKVPAPNAAAQNPSQAGHYAPPQPPQPQPGNFAPPQPQPQPPQQFQAPQPGPQGGFPQPGQPAQPYAPPQGGGGFPQAGQPAAQPGQPQGGGFPAAPGFPQPGQPQAPQPGQPQQFQQPAPGGFPQAGQPQQGGFPAPGFPQQ